MNDEFILTNNLGGYTSYSLTEGVTRKYHGLLTASIRAVERRTIVPTLHERIIKEGKVHDFSGNYYTDIKQPALLQYLKRAFFLPDPTQIYMVDNIKITKSIIAEEENDNRVTIKYLIQTPESCMIEVEPLFTLRDFHDVGLQLDINTVQISYKGNSQQKVQLDDETVVKVRAYSDFELGKGLSNNHFYPTEAERGYDATEDLISIGKYRKELKPGYNEFEISFDIDRFSKIKRLFTKAADIINPSDNTSLATDISRFRLLHQKVNPNFAEFLVYNARKFIIKDDQRYSLLAGYHWFGEWSRDTFISFKGILLGLGRYHEAQRVLLDWDKYISVGLLPNQIQGMHFNSIDGILWYVVSVWYYWQETKDKDTILHLLPKLERVIYALARGTKYGICIEERGFLMWTDENKALTWMDAIVDGKPVTQRAGAAVEIQALWYNCLQIVEKLAKDNNYKLINLPLIDQLENLLETNFEKTFWLEDNGYYADFMSLENDMNSELRPNQLALYSLPFTLGNKQNAEKVIKAVEEKLLTPLGLRTLSPDSSQYIPIYEGDQKQRDMAYHQGIVWPWLLILYYNALVNTSSDPQNTKEKILLHINESWELIKEKQILSIPEIFSGEDLQPTGTISQTWSVAAFIEGILISDNN